MSEIEFLSSAEEELHKAMEHAFGILISYLVGTFLVIHDFLGTR